MELDAESLVMAKMAKEARKSLRQASSADKDRALGLIADALVKNSKEILAANRKDLAAAKTKGLSAALCDRLKLTPERIEAMANSVREVVRLADPVGEITKAWTDRKSVV
jgi:glutamate-5-semialdehyde dehydrogenase